MRTLIKVVATASVLMVAAVGASNAAVINNGGGVKKGTEKKLTLAMTEVYSTFKLDDKPNNLPLTFDCGFAGFYWEADCELKLSGPVNSASGLSILAEISGTFSHKFPDKEDNKRHPGEKNPHSISFSGSLKAGDIMGSSREVVVYNESDLHDNSTKMHEDTVLITLLGTKLIPGPTDLPPYIAFSRVTVNYEASHPKPMLTPLPPTAALMVSAFAATGVFLRRRRA